MRGSRTSASFERRPLASRELGWIQAAASWLTRRGAAPNAISLSSLGFALAGAAAMASAIHGSGLAQRVTWIAAALCVQLRLLANLLDGMVAQESGKTSRTGELFNEVPDRIADALFLIPLGFAPGSSPHLGYAAALLAIFVAYLRTLGAAAGAGQVFAGAMAKPRRMFFVTLLCLYQGLAPASWQTPLLPGGPGPAGLALAGIAAGCVWTAVTRLAEIHRRLSAHP